MAQRVFVAIVAALMICGTFAAAQDVSIELSVVPATVNLGEPCDVLVRIVNGTGAPLLTSDDALSAARMWAYFELVFIDADGIEWPIASDRPMYSPAPSSLWVEHEGEQVAVRPVERLAPGHIAETLVVNLLRYFPLVEPGDYRLSMTYELPIFEEAVTSADTGDMEWVVLDDAEWQSIPVANVEFSLTLSEDITGADLAWFQDARRGLLGVGCGADAVTSFSSLPLDAGDTIRACGLYWIGEACELFWMPDEATASYQTVLEDYPDSLFAAYASRRLAELASGSSP